MAITGGAGIEIPLEPPAITTAQAELRRQRQIAAIEAAEAAAARATTERAPLPRRHRKNDALSLPVSVPRPTPAPKAETSEQPEVPVKPEVPAEPVVALEPEPVEPESTIGPGFDSDAPTQIRQLRTELAMAGQRIRSLLAKVEEQGACIAGGLADLQTATSMAAQLSELATEQQDLLRARAETAERDLSTAHHQIETLIAQLSTPAATDGDNDAQVEPVLCLGTGCGLPVAPDYVIHTGYLWHGPCKDRVPTSARFSGRRVA